MQIRIVAGEINFDVSEMPLKLEVLYQSPNLIIQGDGNIQVIKLANDRQAFIAGTIVGFRSRQNEIVSCSKESRLCRELIASNSIEDCQELFEGRYLLIVFGPGNECRICADRYSQFDLYYQRIGDTTYLGSNLECLPIYGKYSGFDQAGLIHALTVYGFRPPKRHTFYDGVQRLGVGELVHIRNGKVFMDTRPFKAIPTAIYGDRELNEYADLLLDAIRIRGSRYGNVVSLSSGWDSTSILACLVHIFGASKVRAVIGRMHYSKRAGIINQFEIDRAMAMAKYYNVHLDIVDLNYCEIGPDLLEKLQPILKSHCVSSISSISQAILYDFVARTGNGKEVLFVGEISDAVHNLGFSQFTSIFHPVLSFREYSDKMASFLFGPTFLKLMLTGEFINDPIYFLFRNRAGSAIFDEISNDGPKQITRQLLSSFFLRANRLPLISMQNSKMLKQKGIEEYALRFESEYLEQPSQEAIPETLYSWYIYLYNSFHWQSSMIVSRYLMADEFGLTMAMPFWDSRLQEFLSAMPEDWGRGLDLNPTKYPLKWMLKNRIDYPMHLQVGPHSYLYDVDHSFSHSAEILYGSTFNPYLKKLISSYGYRDILNPDLFNLKYIDGLVDGFLRGEEVRGSELTDLFSLCMLTMVGWYGEKR